jgi:hypothetical protein
MAARMLDFQPTSHTRSDAISISSSASFSSLRPDQQGKVLNQINRFILLAIVNPSLADRLLDNGEQLLQSYGI